MIENTISVEEIRKLRCVTREKLPEALARPFAPGILYPIIEARERGADEIRCRVLVSESMLIYITLSKTVYESLPEAEASAAVLDTINPA